MKAIIDEHRQQYGVEPICKVMQIAPSTYWLHARRQAKPHLRPQRAQRDDELAPQVHRVWQDNLQVYGVRKVCRQLHREGVPIARCTVARLMRRLGIEGVIQGKKVRTTFADAIRAIAGRQRLQTDSHQPVSEIPGSIHSLQAKGLIRKLHRGDYAKPAAVEALGEKELLARAHERLLALRTKRLRRSVPLTPAARRVQALARKAGVRFTPPSRTRGPARWRERPVASDATDDLLVALRRADRISPSEMASMVMAPPRAQTCLPPFANFDGADICATGPPSRTCSWSRSREATYYV